MAEKPTIMLNHPSEYHNHIYAVSLKTGERETALKYFFTIRHRGHYLIYATDSFPPQDYLFPLPTDIKENKKAALNLTYKLAKKYAKTQKRRHHASKIQEDTNTSKLIRAKFEKLGALEQRLP